MILSLGGVELPPTAVFLSFLLFFFLANCTHVLMTQCILGAEAQIVTGGLEIAVYFPMLRPSVRRVQMTFRYNAKKKQNKNKTATES